MPEATEHPIDDGLTTTSAGEWSLEKFRLLEYYARIFSTGMKKKWDRVYIDLFAGSGYAKIKNSGQLRFGSPLIALRVPDPFTRYIFCDIDAQALDALKRRVERHAPDADVRYVHGDCNATTGDIIRETLAATKSGIPLTFCYADPFNVALKLHTFETLAAGIGKVDFLILLALWMDARRNEPYYSKPENPRIDTLLDDPDWRPKWDAARGRGDGFGQFLASSFTRSMVRLGYLEAKGRNWREIRRGEGAPLYHLMFFSKHERGFDFWHEAEKYGSTQKQLDLEM